MLIDHGRDKCSIVILLLSMMSDKNDVVCDVGMLLSEVAPFINIELSPESKEYTKVMRELTIIYGHPTCGDFCKFRAEVSILWWRQSYFARQELNSFCRRRECFNYVSKINHRVCHEHAEFEESPLEFNYHHSTCMMLRNKNSSHTLQRMLSPFL